jgi:N-acetylglucosamine-6-sulfatase
MTKRLKSRSAADPTAAGRGRSSGSPERGRPSAGTARRAVPPAAVLAIAAALGLLGVAAAALIPLAGADPAQAKKKEQRPNVVVVMSDDQTVESMRVMNNVNSRLAQFGATFANSFVGFPLCCPSRATFLTGQYAHNHGTLGNGPPEGGFEKFNAEHGGNTLPGWLQADGYYTVEVGKYLNGYGTAQNQTLVPAGWTEWFGAVNPVQGVYDYALNENGTLVPYGDGPEDFKQDVITRRAVEVINRRAPAGQPFFLDVNYTAPHSGGPNPNPNPPGNCEGTAKPAPRHAAAFNSEPLPLPPSFNEQDVADKPPDIQNLDPITTNQRATITRQYRCRLESILSVDEGVGSIVDALKAQHELGDTLFIYTSDNGFFGGEHRVRNGKLRHYEPSSRVPLVMRGPGVPEGKTVRELAVNVDLAKTILDATGTSPGLNQDGRSLIGLAEEPKRELGREIVIETDTYSAIRNARFKYVEHTAGVDAGAVELYDLERDPFELQSQHANPAFAPLRAQLATRLAALRDCAGDGCRTKPKLKLKLEKHGGCAPRGAKARIKGSDAKRLGNASFEVDGKDVGSDGSKPFKEKLGKLKRGRKSKVRATAELTDGRRITLDKKVRACG